MKRIKKIICSSLVGLFLFNSVPYCNARVIYLNHSVLSSFIEELKKHPNSEDCKNLLRKFNRTHTLDFRYHLDDAVEDIKDTWRSLNNILALGEAAKDIYSWLEYFGSIVEKSSKDMNEHSFVAPISHLELSSKFRGFDDLDHSHLCLAITKLSEKSKEYPELNDLKVCDVFQPEHKFYLKNRNEVLEEIASIKECLFNIIDLQILEVAQAIVDRIIPILDSDKQWRMVSYKTLFTDEKILKKLESLKSEKKLTQEGNVLFEGLSKEEKEVLYEYTKGSSGFNSTLRGQRIDESFLEKNNILSNIIKKSRINKDIVVYRAITDWDNFKYMTTKESWEEISTDGKLDVKKIQKLVGKVIHEVAFSSSSINLNIANEFKDGGDNSVLFKISVKKGAIGFPIMENSRFSRDKEVLFNKNSDFMVNKLKYKNNEIVVCCTLMQE